MDWERHLAFEISTLERNGFREISPSGMAKHIRKLRDRLA